MRKYYIQLKKNENSTLLDAVIKHLNVSKSEAGRLIYQGSVWNSARNRRLKDAGMMIGGELVCINYPEYPVDEYNLPPDRIIYEDDHLMIINKEPGLNTCQTPLSDIDCLVHGVQKHYDKAGIKYEVSPVNRLDKPAQGLIFFAKNKFIESRLHIMFRDRRIKKLYLAITPSFQIQKEELIVRDRLEWKGKLSEAATFIKFIKEKDGEFFFIAYPLTGRTHQIRKHFQKYLFPIKGDALYGGYSREDEMKLICFRYDFRHPVTGKKMRVEHLDGKYGCR